MPDTAGEGGVYPPRLLEAVGRIADQKWRRGVSLFLRWLAAKRSEDLACRVLAAFRSGAEPPFADGRAHTRAFVSVLAVWCDEFLNADDDLKRSTRSQYVDAAARGLTLLKNHPGVPAGYSRMLVTVPYVDGEGTRSLGEANWPELRGLSGIERDRRALQLVRSAFVARFEYCYGFFRAARAVLDGPAPPPHCSERAWDELRKNLDAVRRALRETGRFSLPGDAPKKLRDDRLLWRQGAGLDLGEFPYRAYPSMPYRACLGPIRPAMKAAIGVLLCDTGWNLAPVLALSSDPYVFRSSTETFLAEPGFIEAFKARAAHHVIAYLGERTVSGGALECLTQHWARVAADYDPNDDSIGYARLSFATERDEPSTIDVLERYRRMADTFRAEAGKPAERTSFWPYINSTDDPHWGPWARRHGAVPDQRDEPNRATNIADRREVANRSIRKSFLLLKRHDTGSFEITRAVAQHKSTAVLMPHYFNSPHMSSVLDQSIRHFQDAVESVVVGNLDGQVVLLHLEKTGEDIARLRRLADQAGITASLGLAGPAVEAETAGLLYYEPSDANLRELYLTHRKLRQMQARYANRLRFRVEFLPLLALTKAIGREICGKGNRGRYRRAARQAAAALQAGQEALPVFED